MPMMPLTRDGLTVTELLVAGIVGLGILIGGLAVGRQRDAFVTKLRTRGSDPTEEIRPAVAIMEMVRTLETADRTRLAIGPAAPYRVIQARIFAPQGGCAAEPYGPGCLDNPLNYRWIEYGYADTNGDLVRDALRIYRDTGNPVTLCSDSSVIATGITIVSFNYVDYLSGLTGPPPGGDPNVAVFSPGARDLNLMQYAIRWSGTASGEVLVPPGTKRDYNGMIMMRSIPYSDVGAGSAGLTDSGLGMAERTVAQPPAVCTT